MPVQLVHPLIVASIQASHPGTQSSLSIFANAKIGIDQIDSCEMKHAYVCLESPERRDLT